MKRTLLDIRFIFVMIGIAVTLLSCTSDYDGYDEKEVVCFTAEVACDTVTRAVGVVTADRLTVCVLCGTQELQRVEYDFDRSPMNVELALSKGQKYNIVFWAQNSQCGIYDIADITAIRMSDVIASTAFGDVEKRDAFCAVVENLEIDGAVKHCGVVMKRPLALMNVGTAGDAADAVFTVKNAPEYYNPLTKTVSGCCDYVWKFNGCANETFMVEGVVYNRLASGFLFAPENEMKVECEMEISSSNGGYVDIAFGQVVIEANKKSNIVGNLTD